MERVGRRQIDLPTEELREVPLQPHELEEADDGFRVELDEHVDVAVGRRFIARH
jgi:hypothetical protein